MIKSNIILVAILSFLISFGQKTNALEEIKNLETKYNETIYTHLNSLTFISGETLYYKLYCINGTKLTPSDISKLAYVELIDQNNKVLIKQKLFLNEGAGYSDIFISPTIPSGIYRLVAYTKWMLNKTSENCNQNIITIINPYDSNSNSIKTIGNSEIKNTNQNLKKDWQLTTNKKTFSNRELVNVSIKPQNNSQKKGKYSISVRKIEDIPSAVKMSSEDFSNSRKNTTIPESKNLSNVLLPEIRGEQISGKITSKNNSFSTNKITIALSIPGKSFILKLVKTNTEGKFIINLDEEYSNTKLIVQVFDRNKEEYKIELEDSKPLESLKPITQTDQIIDSDLASKIEKRAVANQIQNAYYTKKQDSIIPFKDNDLFYATTQKDYILDNYTRFPNLKETIIEVVKEMYFTKENGNYIIGVRDVNPDRIVNEPALVLVDGLLIQNINELFELKMEDVFKITIVPSGYYYGPDLFSGIINIITKNHDYNSKSVGNYIINTSITSPVSKKYYFKENYSDISKNKRIPDYRNQLLWIPELPLDQSENSISFYTSDINGTYEIQVEGFTDEGIPVSLKEEFEVK